MKKRSMMVFAVLTVMLAASVALAGCGEEPVIAGDGSHDSQIGAPAQTGMQTSGVLKVESPAKVDLSKCESPDLVPFHAYDSAGKALQAVVFPEYWGGTIYCTMGHRDAWANKLADGESADKVAEGSAVRFDFGQYLPSEVTVSRDSGTNPEGVPELTAVKIRPAEDGYEFDALLINEDGPTYYLVSAKWDDSHNIDYAIALEKA